MVPPCGPGRDQLADAAVGATSCSGSTPPRVGVASSTQERVSRRAGQGIAWIVSPRSRTARSAARSSRQPPPETPTEQFEVELLLQDRCAIICGMRHPLAHVAASQLGPRELARQRWIGLGPFMPTLAGTRQLFESAGLVPPDRALETSSLDLTLAELRSGQYLAALPIELVRTEIEAGELRALPLQQDLGPAWNISIYRLAEQPCSTASEYFLDCLRQVAGQAVARTDQTTADAAARRPRTALRRKA